MVAIYIYGEKGREKERVRDTERQKQRVIKKTEKETWGVGRERADKIGFSTIYY